ncbi:MAG: GLUG motif-containing protein [Coriobacteriales bacterium]|jgi:predicted  nucleic acid-binding Zn-ribbon protein
MSTTELPRHHVFRKAAQTLLAAATAAAFMIPVGAIPQAHADDVNLDDGIDSAAELVAFAEAVNGGTSYSGSTVKLNSDLDLSGTTMTSIGTEEHPFDGVFDGQGHKITGIDMTGSLFGSLVGTSSWPSAKYAGVKNLFVSGKVTSSASKAGGLVGSAVYAEFTRVGADVDVTDSAEDATGVGGLIGSAYSKEVSSSWSTSYQGTVKIENCFARGDVTAESGTDVGGLVGTLSAGAEGSYYKDTPLIENCYSTGTVKGKTNVGGLVGNGTTLNTSTDNRSVKSSYSASTVSGTEKVGATFGLLAKVDTRDTSTNTDYNVFGLSQKDASGNDVSSAGEGAWYAPDLKTSDELKGMAETLGSAFIDDSVNINSGYPILVWDGKANGAPVTDMAKATIEVGELTFTGSAVDTSAITVKDKDGKTLELSKNYTLSWYSDEAATNKLDSDPVDAGDYYVVATGIGMCDGSTAPAKVTIGKATLTATYKSEAIYKGEEPKLEVEVTGWKGYDPSWSYTLVKPTVSLPEEGIEGGKTYELTPEGGSYSSNNYNFEYVSGTLTVHKSYTEYDAEIADLNSQLKTATDELTTAKSDLEKAQSDLETANKTIADLQEQLKSAPTQETIDELNKQLEQANTAKETAEDNLKTAQENLDKATKELEQTKSDLEKLKSEDAELQKKLEQAQADLKAANEKAASLNKQLEQAQTSLKTASEKSEMLQKQLDETSASLAAERAKNAKAEKSAASALSSLKGAMFIYKKAQYKITSTKTVTYVKYLGKKSKVTVGPTAKLGSYKFSVTKLGAKAFKGTKAKKLTIKAPKLVKKTAVKNCLKASKVKSVKVRSMKRADKKKVVKAFKKKGWTGKKVKVK